VHGRPDTLLYRACKFAGAVQPRHWQHKKKKKKKPLPLPVGPPFGLVLTRNRRRSTGRARNHGPRQRQLDRGAAVAIEREKDRNTLPTVPPRNPNCSNYTRLRVPDELVVFFKASNRRSPTLPALWASRTCWKARVRNVSATSLPYSAHPPPPPVPSCRPTRRPRCGRKVYDRNLDDDLPGQDEVRKRRRGALKMRCSPGPPKAAVREARLPRFGPGPRPRSLADSR